MAGHIKKGNLGEQEAVQFLFANGYEILRRNYRHKQTEIDIIARKDELVVFVEVKSRSSLEYGNPEDFVSEAQKKRIVLAADHWIHHTAWDGEIRFDIIAISNQKGLEHIEDAFFIIED